MSEGEKRIIKAVWGTRAAVWLSCAYVADRTGDNKSQWLLFVILCGWCVLMGFIEGNRGDAR